MNGSDSNLIECKFPHDMLGSQKGSLSAMVKLLSCDLVVTGSSCGNNLLQYRVRLRTIDPFSGPYIDRSLMHRTVFFLHIEFSQYCSVS